MLALAGVLVLGQGQPRVEAQDAAAINNAVTKGVNRLRALQGAGGVWAYQHSDMDKDVGASALAGLAMIECEVPLNDSAITSAALFISRAEPRVTETYGVAAAIMFLDRAGGAAKTHSAAIQRYANKLLRSQTRNGDWGYGGMGNGAGTDNSNTQFAILGLWAARKHGVNVEEALKRTEQHFRKTQDKDGGWRYGFTGPQGDPTTPTMTCAGLLGLFLGFGQKKEKEAMLRASKAGDIKDDKPAPAVNLDDIRTDPAVLAAMRYLKDYVGSNLQGIQHWLYLLWSVERVCVTYDFKNVNGVDWYAWGSDILVRSQLQTGEWRTDHGPVVDTAFALLFLKKANLVGPLQTELRASRDGKAPAPGKAGAKDAAGNVPKEEEDRGKKLAQDLVKASAAKQSQLIDEYKSARGTDYTTALAEAIASLSGGAKDKARIALAERFERMSSKQLGIYMEDTNREMRQAAAVAAGRKGKDDIVPDLIKLLADRDSGVTQSAYESLKSISGKNLDKDPAAWEAWWKAKGSK
jgi:hypothetical protein